MTFAEECAAVLGLLLGMVLGCAFVLGIIYCAARGFL
jgi:hypothetical protein